MARPAATYRGARRNAARVNKIRWPGAQARYMPYFTKPPRLKFGVFQVGAKPDPANDCPAVPYTDLRKQPRVYRS